MTRRCVVHVCRSGFPAVGGLERSVHGLARAQQNAGYDVHVVTLDRDASGVRLHPCVHQGVRYQRLRRWGPASYPFAAGLLSAVHGADLVHVHGIDGLADVLVLRRRHHGVPVGISTHGGLFPHPASPRVEGCLVADGGRVGRSRAQTRCGSRRWPTANGSSPQVATGRCFQTALITWFWHVLTGDRSGVIGWSPGGWTSTKGWTTSYGRWGCSCVPAKVLNM